jgi:hypothetical protein
MTVRGANLVEDRLEIVFERTSETPE